MALKGMVFAVVLATAMAVPAQPPADAFRVLAPLPEGPQITPYLLHQVETAWREDRLRRRQFEAIRTEQELLATQSRLRQKLLAMIGGLPKQKTALNPRIVGRIEAKGFHIEKLIFESLPQFYVTALVYVPDDARAIHPAVLVPAGHSPVGKAYYQALCQRLALRGYLVISWDPVGQGERSQFWDAKAKKSGYNLICAEHAVLGNLAYLAGANLARWEIWDGIRAVDYLLTRRDVDPSRISITGTSGGGFQAAHIAALDPRIKVVVPSCYISSLPMRMHNRIFKDPDSDPEQDLSGMISEGVDHAGLLLLMYPRPVAVAAAVLDFFPIEGTQKTYDEIESLYERFGRADRIMLIEGYHGHEYSLENQMAAFAFLDRFNRMPQRNDVAEIHELPVSDLQCTNTGQVSTDFPDARPLTDFISDYFLTRKAEKTSPGSLRHLYAGAGYPAINSWKVGHRDSGADIQWERIGSSSYDGVTITQYVLCHGRWLEIPLVHITGPNQGAKGILMWFGASGKADVSDWGEITRLIKEGYQIVSFDPRGLGETRMRYKAVSEDDPSLARLEFDQAYVNPVSGVLADYVYNSLLIGRPYFLEMIEDTEIAAKFTRAVVAPRATDLYVSGNGNGYFLAESAAEVLPGMKLLATRDATGFRWSEVVETKRESWPIQFLLPGGAYIH